MKTEEEITDDIFDLTMKIKESSFELSKYINEMPAPIPCSNDSEINRKTLTDYYESLVTIWKRYQSIKDKNIIFQNTSSYNYQKSPF